MNTEHRKIVPLHTGKVAIGIRYVPPKTATYASPGSYYRPQESRLWWWCFGIVSVVGLLIVGATR